MNDAYRDNVIEVYRRDYNELVYKYNEKSLL